jgi:Ca2+-binding RTX toxin-like protein
MQSKGTEHPLGRLLLSFGVTTHNKYITQLGLKKMTIQGTPEDDLLKGTPEADRIKGTEGDDRIKGSKGDDYITGGQGNDYLAGGAGDDVIKGGTGNDVLKGGEGDDLLFGSQQNGVAAIEKDILSGGAGSDKFVLYDTQGDRTFYTGYGDADFADLIDFTSEDKIILGAGEDYSFTAHNGHTQIFSNGDLVAIVRNACTELVQSSVQYIGGAA